MTMLRRPPGERRRSAQQKRLLLAFAFILLPFIHLAAAQQQHRPVVPDPALSPFDRSAGHRQQLSDDAAAHPWAATSIESEQASYEAAADSKRVDSVKTQERKLPLRKPRKNDHDNIVIPHDASALATLAPAQSVRAPNPPRQNRPSSVPASGLASPQHARSLEDWEVEDFVLLATVDGDLYASDRKTGKERWHLEVDHPMVETTHYRSNESVLDDDYNPVDHYIWAVEPSRDGDVYVWVSDSDTGLIRTPFTMKKLVEELAPWSDENLAVVYTGDKKTTMITLDAATGRVLKWFGSGGSHVNQDESCLRPNTLYDLENEECSSTGTITLGRTEYTVGIHRRDGRSIATLKYSEWGPNNFDNDLYQQHQTSLDSRYMTSQHDGKVYAFDYARAAKAKPVFSEDFASPVAKVFDVCRPWDATLESNPDLVVLPQPPMPSQDPTIARMRSNSIFLNRTKAGGWYAMSGRAYPLIINAPIAQISRPDWWELAPAWDTINQAKLAEAIIGTHFLDTPRGESKLPPSLSAGMMDSPNEDQPNDSSVSVDSIDSEELIIITKFKLLPQRLANSVIEFVSNPIVILLCILTLIYNEGKIRKLYLGLRSKGLKEILEQHLLQTPPKSAKSIPHHEESDKEEERVNVVPEPVKEQQLKEDVESKLEPKLPSVDTPILSPPEEGPVDRERPVTPNQEQHHVNKQSQPKSPETAKASTLGTPNGGTAPENKKKKAHRGRRGGVKHRKGRAREMSQSRDDDPAPATVEEAVKNAQKLAERPSFGPDVMTVANDMQSVTGPIVRMGNIEVNTNEQLGIGSNGTLVFAGKFDGRDVAVKRMLIQFYDVASRETGILRESDDHPNVIRYYSQQFLDGFLYIALERCAASLADVIEKPTMYRELADAGGKDISNVLYQIASGINHLHGLRIVHRDLKPQNILVNLGSNGKPRLLVSDFGLCKKLEGNQSSFGATAGRAAGTSGWRAPELLLQDDASESGQSRDMTEGSNQSGSGSTQDQDQATSLRRATRAIDIFSLGLVFFYVLSGGCHPFDCGDRYMREVNIRKGQYKLDALESLGEYSEETIDLISSMIQADPQHRPTAKEVMSHPFFWSAKKKLAFLCDVSDHFEKEPRDPPSDALIELERHASEVTNGDFLKHLPRDFVDSLGKQRKYVGSRSLDLLRALRNKRNHYEDMSDNLKRTVGPLPDGYLSFWISKFPKLLLVCWNVVYFLGWDETDRFREYYQAPAV